ncbi:Pex19 protein family-domain-containing protein [Podospora fimiseda]|uniref:Pex19 protein family-domain-containing protein n=1 Tax=Podospora fimiseda TaxID=252190 RepID=A0AAN7H5I6_9PEZI|nr:Pex19 protein family-domain-containing protein [Podospora fimiseda]
MSEKPAGEVGAFKQDVPPVKAEEKRTVTVEDDYDDVPDPDEDDLDDLDDLLEEFSTAKLDGKKPEIPAGPGIPATAGPAKPTADDNVLDEEEFAKQLQAGMADLLGEIDSSPEMQAQFESIFKELGAAAANAESTPDASKPGISPQPAFKAASAAAARAGAEASFQETIRKTMERMQNSGEQATAAATAEGTDDFLAELLKQMGSGEGGGEGNEEDFTKMLLGMMDQLTNKEILYEPMKELHEKFPEWFEKNKDKCSPEDLKKYKEQQVYVDEITAKFEEPTYSDSNKPDREYILDRMQKMQALGQPPSDLVGEMPSTQEALGLPEDGCTPQ